MLVKYNYLFDEFKNSNEIFNDWKKLINSTEFTLGPYVENFEKKFADYTKSKYCISVNNGTDALILALKSINLNYNDEVLIPVNTFYATVGAAVAVGLKPVFVDVGEDYQICISDLIKKINSKTRAIIPVHWAGASPNMIEIIKISKKYKLKVIEDACMGIGGLCYNRHPGTFGDLGAFSLHPLKSLNAMGDGGMIVTNKKNIFDWCRKYRNHGMKNRDNIDFWGVNMRMQPLQSIVAMHGLKKIDSVIRKRNSNAKLLDNLLSKLKPFIQIPSRNVNNIETYSLYMILAKKRNSLARYLKNKKIEVKIHYPKPLHLQKASRIFGYKKGDFPIAEKQANQLLTLPVHQFLTNDQIFYTVESIKKFYSIS